MAFDGEPGGDPRGRCCPGCKRPVQAHQASTHLRFKEDPDGLRGFTGAWHAECARPFWDKLTPALEALRRPFA